MKESQSKKTVWVLIVIFCLSALLPLFPQITIPTTFASAVNNSNSDVGLSGDNEQIAIDNETQPTWPTSVTNSHGTVTYSGSNSPNYSYKAFDGVIGVSNEWNCEAKSGWVQLTLNYPIYVQQIIFYNKFSGSSHRTKAAYFTGTGGISLGSGFTGHNSDAGRSDIYVGGVWTNIIRLNITSSYGSYIGASEIVIIATV